MSIKFTILAMAALGSTLAQASIATDDNVSTNRVPRDSTATAQHESPTWGVELAGSPLVAGGTGLASAHPASDSNGFSLQVEYQPRFLRGYGTLGAGPVAALYPVSTSQGITHNGLSIWSVGAAVRYQARYFRNQWIVPSLGYQYEQLRYTFLTGQQGWTSLAGPVVGVEFLLNALDRERADDLYAAAGISHTYLVAEARDLTGADATIHAAAVSWFFGLRLEM